MTRVRYTADGGHYRIGGYGFDPGDEKDVDGELAEHLEDVGVFEVVEGEGADATSDSLEGKPVSDVDVSEHLDRWLDQPYDHRAKQVQDGDADDSLDEIEEAETSETVIDAIEERRSELEEA